MTVDQQSKLSNEQTDALLSNNETGVLSLANENEPYAIPISYGYDAQNRRFYLRLVSTPESEKRQFLPSSPETRLVVCEDDGEIYESVVARGTLEEIPRDELTADHIEQYGDAKRPLFEMWGESKQDLNVRLYQLDPETLSGRRIEVDRDTKSP